MPQGVAGEPRRQPSLEAISGESRLNLALLESTSSPGEQRGIRIRANRGQVLAEEPGGLGEERRLTPGTALGATDQDPLPIEVDVSATEKAHLADPQAVLVDHREQRAVADAPKDAKERLELGLRKVAGRAWWR